MPKIGERDILRAETAKDIFYECPATCFLGKGCWENECLLFKLSQNLEENDALSCALKDLIGTRQRYCHTKPSKQDFLVCLIYGTLVFFYAYGKRFPSLNQEIANAVIIKSQNNPRKFFRRIRTKLFKLHPFWLTDFRDFCREAEVDGYFWNLVLLFLALLMKAEEWDAFCRKNQTKQKKKKSIPNPKPLDGKLEEYSRAAEEYLEQIRRAS